MKIGNPEAAVGVGAVRAQDTAQKHAAETKTAAAPDASVAGIAQAIENGSFKVNAEVIADKLIANAQELLGKVGSK
jgi:negative regulator of flagellin synthesis FlgM